jgi:putative membrane protein
MNFKLLKENPYYQVLRKPEMYISQVGKSTLIVGLIVFVINYIYINTGMHEIKIPNGLHSLVGFVIALLLVFRTNTAYDRWWEGRKQLAVINAKISFIITVLNSCDFDKEDVNILKSNIKKILKNLKDYLKDNSRMEGDPLFHLGQMKIITECMVILKKHNNSNRIMVADQDMAAFNNSFNALMESITACERIKNTPIPFSYYIHLKISIILFLVTLPFSMLHSLNLWSTPIVMILYFMISGVEIISNEIENPFSGEPNDLPVDNLISKIDFVVK